MASGWWGYARHMNYSGEILQAIGLALTAGTYSYLPWIYPFYYVFLLIARERDDNERCALKYGKLWDEYCKKVSRFSLATEILGTIQTHTLCLLTKLGTNLWLKWWFFWNWKENLDLLKCHLIIFDQGVSHRRKGFADPIIKNFLASTSSSRPVICIPSRIVSIAGRSFRSGRFCGRKDFDAIDWVENLVFSRIAKFKQCSPYNHNIIAAKQMLLIPGLRYFSFAFYGSNDGYSIFTRWSDTVSSQENVKNFSTLQDGGDWAWAWQFAQGSPCM